MVAVTFPSLRAVKAIVFFSRSSSEMFCWKTLLLPASGTDSIIDKLYKGKIVKQLAQRILDSKSYTYIRYLLVDAINNGGLNATDTAKCWEMTEHKSLDLIYADCHEILNQPAEAKRLREWAAGRDDRLTSIKRHAEQMGTQRPHSLGG